MKLGTPRQKVASEPRLSMGINRSHQEQAAPRQHESDQQFLRWVGRHCVAVGWEDSAPGEVNPTGGFAFSAFVMSVRGLWCFL